MDSQINVIASSRKKGPNDVHCPSYRSNDPRSIGILETAYYSIICSQVNVSPSYSKKKLRDDIVAYLNEIRELWKF